MQMHRSKWRADRGARALKRLANIEATIAALQDEDLLDLADIFLGAPMSPLSGMAAAETARRQLRL